MEKSYIHLNIYSTLVMRSSLLSMQYLSSSSIFITLTKLDSSDVEPTIVDTVPLPSNSSSGSPSSIYDQKEKWRTHTHINIFYFNYSRLMLFKKGYNYLYFTEIIPSHSSIHTTLTCINSRKKD